MTGWKPREDADERPEKVCDEILALLEIQNRFQANHFNSVLQPLLWKYTEADGSKYSLRWRSAGAMTADRSDLRHEHVVTRKELTSALIAGPVTIEAVRRTMSDAVACLVTKREHDQLSEVARELRGWARYEAAGIECRDLGAQVGPEGS